MKDMNELLQPPSLDECKKVLCIQPHPDDNEIGMGGIISTLAENNCEIHYLTITDGRLGDMGTPYSPDELVAIRKEETEKSGKYLGAKKFFYFNYKDGSLSDIPRLSSEIGELIREEQYDSIFCPDPWLSYEAHNDHIVTGKSCAQAAISCSLKSYPEGTNTKSCVLRAVGFYFTDKPNTVIDITNHFEKKFEAMAIHKTQMNEELLNLYETYFKLRGNQLLDGRGLGEGLKMLRPIHLHAFPEAKGI